jgi:hypothetical protein
MFLLQQKISKQNTLSVVGSFLLLMSFTQPALAIAPYSATYAFNLDNKASGTATRQLSKQGNNWLYSFSARVPMLATANEKSTFSFDNQQVTSKQFTREYKILVHNQVLSLNFDAANKVVNVKKNKDSRQYPLQSNVLDDLNAEIQIREDLKNNKLKSSYLIANQKDIDARNFVNAGSVKVTTPAGSYDAVKVIIKHHKNDKQTTFWLAPKLDYLPVKVTHVDDKQTYTLSLTGYKAS